MKIKLYQPGLFINEQDMRVFNLEINHKIIQYGDLIYDQEEIPYPIFEERHYKFEKDTRYYGKYPKLKLNHKFVIYRAYDDDIYGRDDGIIAGLEGYTRLNWIKRFRLNWIFGKTWFQQSENIKWLISIPISIITAWITAKIVG